MHYIIPPIEKICTHRSISLSDVLSSKPLESIRTYGATAECTDFSLLHLSTPFLDDYGKNDNRISGRYWISNEKVAGMGCQPSGSHETRFLVLYLTNSAMGIRPMLMPETTKYILPIDTYFENGRKTDKIHNKGDVQIATYGAYPQTIADKETSDKLTMALSNGTLKTTGKTYTHTTREYIDVPIETYTYPEYEFEGNKYIYVEALSDGNVEAVSLGETIKYRGHLSNGEHYYKNKPYWIKVEPVEWLTDESGYWMTKKIVTGGIPYHLEDTFLNSHTDSFAYKYLNSHFKNDFEQNIVHSDLSYQLWLCETLSQSPIPDNRIQYMQKLSQTVKIFSQQFMPNDNLLKEINQFTKSLIKDFTQQSDLDPQKHFEQLCCSVLNKKKRHTQTKIDSCKPKSFWTKMASFFQQTRN